MHLPIFGLKYAQLSLDTLQIVIGDAEVVTQDLLFEPVLQNPWADLQQWRRRSRDRASRQERRVVHRLLVPAARIYRPGTAAWSRLPVEHSRSSPLTGCS